jgi:hypothetical protein
MNPRHRKKGDPGKGPRQRIALVCSQTAFGFEGISLVLLACNGKSLAAVATRLFAVVLRAASAGLLYRVK